MSSSTVGRELCMLSIAAAFAYPAYLKSSWPQFLVLLPLLDLICPSFSHPLMLLLHPVSLLLSLPPPPSLSSVILHWSSSLRPCLLGTWPWFVRSICRAIIFISRAPGIFSERLIYPTRVGIEVGWGRVGRGGVVRFLRRSFVVRGGIRCPSPSSSSSSSSFVCFLSSQKSTTATRSRTSFISFHSDCTVAASSAEFLDKARVMTPHTNPFQLTPTHFNPPQPISQHVYLQQMHIFEILIYLV